MKEAESAAEKAVLAPDVIGKSFFDPSCWRILTLWRNGRLHPVVNRDLLKEYVRLLHGLGLDLPLIRQWVLWFTAPEKSFYLDQGISATMESPGLCREVARLGEARWIIAFVETRSHAPLEKVSGEEITCMTPAAYLASLEK